MPATRVIRIYKDAPAASVFFEGTRANPLPCNVGTAAAHPTLSDRIRITRSDKKRRDGQDRVIFKQLRFRNVHNESGVQISDTDRQVVIDYLNSQLQESAAVDVNAAYKGNWNATTNTPDITGSAAENGDWYYVGTSGSFDAGSGSIDFLVNDIVKYVSRSDGSTEWERVANETVRVDTLDAEIDGIIQGGALSQFDIYVDANYTGSEQLGTSLRPYTTLQDAVDNAPSSGHTEVLVNGDFTITTAISITGNKNIHFTGTEGSKVKYASYSGTNGGIFTYTGTDYSGRFRVQNLTLQNAGAFAVNAVSASRVEVYDCTFNNNGWSGTGISLTEEEDGSTLGYNSSTASLASFYAAQCSEGGAIHLEGVVVTEITDNVVNNNNKGLEIVDCGYVGTTNGSGFIARNQIYNNISIGIELESSAGDATAGCQNFTAYNNSVLNHGDTGIKIEGGLNNTISLSIIKGNWNAGIELEHVSNTRCRDLDLDNNNRAGVDAEGDQANGVASVQVGGATIHPEATFIADIFNVAILNTQLGSNAIKCGVVLKDSLENHTDDASIIKLDNLTFMNQDYALDIVCDLTNLKLIVGECEYLNNSVQPVRVQGEGNFSELPYKNFTIDIPYLNVEYDRVAKEVILKEQRSGQVINAYPVNTLQSVVHGTSIDIIQKDSRKIQLRGLTEDRIQTEGLWASGNINDVNNTLNAVFTETIPSITTPTTTIAVDGGTTTTFTTSSTVQSGSDGYSASSFNFNGAVVFIDETIDEAGEYYEFTISDPGTIIMGLHKSGSTGTYGSSSLGVGDVNGITGGAGMYWGLGFRESTQGPWKAFGEGSSDTAYQAGFYNFDDSDTGADWLNGTDITMRVGLNNDGIPYIAYSSSAAGGFVDIARDGTAATGYNDEFNLVIKLVTADEPQLTSTPTVYQTDVSLTYYAIESPDGSWYYPMFVTEDEATTFDTDVASPAGSGVADQFTFPDDLSGQGTWYIPESGSFRGVSTNPTGSIYSGSTFNIVATAADQTAAPAAFTDATVTLDEGASLNYQVAPVSSTTTTTLVNPPSWISLAGGTNVVGTAPQVLLDNLTVPSASYTVTVRNTNAYGYNDGTLTVNVTNTTSNVSLDGTIHQGTFLSEADYNNDYGTSFVTSVYRDALIRTAPFGDNGAVYDLPYALDDGDSYEWPFTAYLNFGIVSESVDKTGSDIVDATDFNTRFDLLFSNRVNGSTLQFSRPNTTDLVAVGWDDNSYRDFPGGPHATTFNAGNPKDMLKLYNNAGRIELHYDINDGNGYQLFASSSELYGTGSDAPTITAVCPDDFNVDYVTLPTITYTANGASAPNGFSLVQGAMDNSLETVSESVVSIDSIEIGAGERLVISQEWADTNVLPYISELGDANHKILLGVSASSPSWGSIGQSDFDSVVMWTNEGTNYTRERLYVTGSGAGTNNVTSDTDSYFDHVIEFTRDGNLFIGRTPSSSLNAETLLTTDTSWTANGIVTAWTASRGNEDPITPIMASDNSRMRLSSTGLDTQRAPLPVRQYDVVEDTYSLPLFKRYNETDVAFGGLTLSAGQTYKFWLHDSSIESTDSLSFVSASDTASAITEGITSSGTPGTFGSYLEFAVPSDVQPLKVVWTTGGTSTTGSVSIAGSTYVEGVTGITLEGPSGNQTGTNLFNDPAVDSDGVVWGWLSIDEQLNAGQRFIMDNAFLVDLTDAMPNNSGIFIGLKSSSWTSNYRNNSIANATVGGARFAIYKYSSSDIRVFGYVTGGTTIGRNIGTSGVSGVGLELAMDLTNSGNNIRLMMRTTGTGYNGSNDVDTTPYADWDSSYKTQTGDQGYGLSAVDIMFLGDANVSSTAASAAMDTADVDWTGLSEINVPTPDTIETEWTKAIAFAGGNERMEQVDSSGNRVPMVMASLGTNVAQHSTSGSSYTSDDSDSRPWATSIVFQSTVYNDNQHIWNIGEGTGTTDDNIYLRRSSDRKLYFGWGRSGTTELNECYIGSIHNNIGSNWWGVYVASNGTRLGSGHTAAQIADCFDIRFTSADGSWTVGSNLSTATNWTSGSFGGRMNRSIASPSMTLGGRGTNRSFRGKIAAYVTTTLRQDQPMPDTTEIGLIITDPKKWLDDYKVGNDFRLPWQGTDAGFNFALNDGSSNYATQVYLMGDGELDSYSNMIRNEVQPTDQNYTKMNMLSMASDDIETVTISGLT